MTFDASDSSTLLSMMSVFHTWHKHVH